MVFSREAEIFEKNFQRKHFLNKKLYFKIILNIVNSNVVGNVFPEKISPDLHKFKYYKKLVKNDIRKKII